jgi:hypothetical protein
VGSYSYAQCLANWWTPSVSDYCYSSKREGVFWTFGLRPSFISQSEFVDYNKLILRGATVRGLRLPKVLKNMINNIFQVKYMYRNLRTQNEDVHNMESMIGTKVDAVPQLRARELRLNGKKRNRLKGEAI